MKNGEKRGARLFNLSFDMGIVVGERGAISHPNIYNVLSP
jgi:hypothetical protein